MTDKERLRKEFEKQCFAFSLAHSSERTNPMARGVGEIASQREDFWGFIEEHFYPKSEAIPKEDVREAMEKMHGGGNWRRILSQLLNNSQEDEVLAEIAQDRAEKSSGKFLPHEEMWDTNNSQDD